MKAIIADTKFQGRVQSIDINHVRKLAMMRDQTGELAPIVTFLDGKSGQYFIGDGFHRWKESLIRKSPSIRSYVVDAEEWEKECRMFAAMCNRELCLPRTQNDIRKAVEMLFGEPEFWMWSNKRIADHSGSTSGTVANYRCDYSLAHNLPLPDHVESESGKWHSYRGMTKRPALEARTDGDGRVRLRIVKGKDVIDLGVKGSGAIKKLEEFKAKAADGSERKHNPRRDQLWHLFHALGFVFEWDRIDRSRIKTELGCLVGHNTLVVWANLGDELRLARAVGEIKLIEAALGMSGHRLVVCHTSEIDFPILKACTNRLGIEFLSPQELARSLKGEEAS